MRNKIIRSFLIILSLSFVIGFGILYGVLYYVSLNQQTSNLNDELSIIVQTNFEESQQIGEELFDKDTRLTMISSDGEVLYDNFDDSINENHLQREEIKEASKNGTGSSVRYSKTMEQNYLYVAEYDAQEQTYVRLAMPFSGVSQSALMLLPSFFIAFVIAFFFVWLMSKRMADSILKPLQEISAVIRKADFGKEKIEFQNYSYSELQEITDALQTMNNQIAKNLENLEREKQIRQEFFTNASHELKTPITSIKVLAESLNTQENVPIEVYQEFMQDITSEIDRENQIITDLLSLVKMDKKVADLNITQVNINELLEQLLKRLHPIAAQKNVELILDSFRPVNAEVDATKLSLAFSNLIENGIKYNNENGWVRVSLNADHKYFYVTVADSGIGIPEESIAHIFERFYRVDKSHSREIGGTGLGLAIARSAIVMHRGAIRVYSKENEGTTFSVRIPLNYVM